MSFDFQNTSAISSFRHELSIINSYLSIEKTRFGNRLEVLFDIDEDIDFILPPLMIQPLVENAVLHGVSKKRDRGACIRSAADHQLASAKMFQPLIDIFQSDAAIKIR